MFNVTPVLWLSADAERVQSADADARLSAALKFDPELTNDLSRYIKPSRSRKPPSIVHLAFDHPVNYYIVDGSRLAPNQIPSTGLLMSSGVHAIFAVCPDGIGVSTQSGDADYTFAPFAQQRNEIAEAVAKGSSEDIILQGSSVDFSPISAEIAWPWVNAMQSFRLTHLISEDTVQQLSAEQQRQVHKWQGWEAQLASWR